MAKTPPSKLTPATLKTTAPGKARAEIGMSGLAGAVAGQGWIYDESLPELVGLSGRATLRKMVENEPIIWSSLYAIEQLVRNVAWRVEPNADAPTSAAEHSVKFVESVLFEDLDVPFAEVVADALTMLPYGFSLQEMVFKQRKGFKSDDVASSYYDDGYWGIARLAPRLQDTIWRWQYGEGADRLIGVDQQPPTGNLVTIPYWKLMHYRTTASRTNPEGRPITRGAYIAWKRKQELERAEGRMMSRAAGFVEVRIPGAFLSAKATPDQKLVAAAYKLAADNIAAERQGSILLPSDKDEKGNPLYDIVYKTTDSRRASEIAASIERYDRRIAMTMLTDFILIGHESVGSFALSSSKTSIFARSIGSILNVIADQFNRVLLPTLWSLNGFDPDLMPTLVPGDLEERDLAEMGAFLTALAGAGMPLFPDEATENSLRELAGLPSRSESSQAQATATPGDAESGGEKPADEAASGVKPKGESQKTKDARVAATNAANAKVQAKDDA